MDEPWLLPDPATSLEQALHLIAEQELSLREDTQVARQVAELHQTAVQAAGGDTDDVYDEPNFVCTYKQIVRK